MGLTVGELKQWLEQWPPKTRVLSYDPEMAYYYDDAQPESVFAKPLTPGVFQEARDNECAEQAVFIR